jgi:cytochrome d ubiquinol oxidase subunit II
VWAVAAFTVLVALATFHVQPQVSAQVAANPVAFAFPALALCGLVAAAVCLRRAANVLAFLSSTAYLLGMLGSAFAGVHPFVLPSSGDPAYGLTIYNTASGDYGLRIGLVWWVIGMALAAAYFILSIVISPGGCLERTP